MKSYKDENEIFQIKIDAKMKKSLIRLFCWIIYKFRAFHTLAK